VRHRLQGASKESPGVKSQEFLVPAGGEQLQ
jgi:hypothetical protein